jgi:dTDP-4-amino-4,6-dideoxygalactose transaminase
MKRVYYAQNLMFIDEIKAGFSREAAVKALTAEGVQVGAYTWNLLHNYPIMQEARWWHHLPAMPDQLPGADRANRTCISLPYFTSDAPELVDQYVKAFEKVWAHRAELAKA